MSAAILTIRIEAGRDADRGALDRTLRSIHSARRRLRRLGYDVEVSIVRSEPGPGEEGLGRTRGAVVASCRAGEVIDPRFLAASARLLESFGDRAVVHANRVVVVADAGAFRLRTPDMRRDEISLEALFDANPWPGCWVTSATLLRDFDGGDLRTAAHYGWTLGTVAAGVPHLTVPAVNVIPAAEWEQDARRVLPIDAETLSSGLESLRSVRHDSGVIDITTGPQPADSGRTRAGAPRRVAQRLRRIARRIDARIAERAALRGARDLGATGAVPPQEISTHRGSVRGDDYAHQLIDAWRSLDASADTLIVTAQVSTRSSDRVALEYARVLANAAPEGTRIAILTSGPREHTESGLIPPEVLHYPLDPGFADLDPDRQGQLIAQLALLTRTRRVLVVDPPSAALSFEVGEPERDGPRYWLRIGSVRRAPLPAVDCDRLVFVTEGPRAARRAAEQLRTDPSRVLVHVPPPLPVMPDFETVTQYTAAYDDASFDGQYPFHVLWRTSIDDAASRGPLLASLLETIADRNLPVRVHVHHEVGIVPDDTSGPERTTPALEDHGRFTGGLLNVPSEYYHCLVVDRGVRDGGPFTRQAMLLGLPIVASQPADDLLEHDATCLIAPEDDARSLIAGIEALLSSRDLRRRLIRAAYDRVRALSDLDPFDQAVARDLALEPSPSTGTAEQ